jgi:hypothetical protein
MVSILLALLFSLFPSWGDPTSSPDLIRQMLTDETDNFEKGEIARRGLGERAQLFFVEGGAMNFIEKSAITTKRILASTSPSDRAVVHPVSSPIGCVMIRSLPARAGRLPVSSGVARDSH